jgi:hypothetical protein
MVRWQEHQRKLGITITSELIWVFMLFIAIAFQLFQDTPLGRAKKKN